MATVRIRIAGQAAPGGSKKFIGVGRPLIPQTKSTKPWMQRVSAAAEKAMQEQHPDMLLAGPLRLTFQQFLPRPGSHFGSGRNANILKPSSPKYPWRRSSGDLTKLIRSTEDAMKKVVFSDDKQIVKFGGCGIDYLDERHAAPYVVVFVEELDDDISGESEQGRDASDRALSPVVDSTG